MSFIEVSVVVIIAATIGVLLVYVYLYVQHREKFIGLWILSWLIHLLKTVLFTLPGIEKASVVIQTTFLVSSVVSSLFQLWGTTVFVNKNIHKGWVYGAVISTLIGTLAILLDQSILCKSLLSAIFIGSILIWTGIVFIRHLDIKGIGKYIVGVAFIFRGVHHMDFPFMADVLWFIPWAYLIDAVLRFIIAIGTLLVYFEKMRCDLSRKEEYYRLLTENAADVIFRYRLTPAMGFEYISPAVTMLTGYSPEEFYKDPALLWRIGHSNDLAIYKNHSDPLRLLKAPITGRLLCKNAVEIWIEQKSNPIYDEDGRLIAVEGIARDITSRKMLEQDVARLDRLNTVGEMAASVAHEIRNPMTTVRGYLQLLGNKKEFVNYKDRFALLMEELDRTNSIISEYLSLSHNRMMDFKAGQLNQIITAIFPLIQADANAGNKYLNLALQDIPDIYIDEKEIRQLILNLVRNGLEAMPSGKTLTIRTYLHKEEVVLAIQDEGGGIPPHILENLGRPFMTTKEEGTGIGLAICYRIANRHNANITVETGASGTTFFIHFSLPQSQQPS